jgi:hypothetical protein
LQAEFTILNTAEMLFHSITKSTDAFGKALKENLNDKVETLGIDKTESLNSYDHWSNKVINDYLEVHKLGVDGDVPLPGGFASEMR